MFGISKLHCLPIAIVGILLFPAFASGQLGSHSNSGEIQWTENLDAAMQNAQATNRPVMVHFTGDHCPPCRLLERKTFHDKSLVTTIHQRVIPVKINVDRNRDIADRFSVTAWPTDVYLMPNGDEIDRGVSNSDPTIYIRTIERIALRHRDWSVQQQATAKFQQRKQERTLAATQVASRSQMPVGALPSRASSKTESESKQWSGVDLPVVTNVSPTKPIVNPYANGSSPDPVSAHVGIGAASVIASTVPPAPTYQPNGHAVTVPVANQFQSEVPAQQPPQYVPAATSTAPIANTVPRAPTYNTAPSSNGLPPTPGLEGYCPVTLRRSILAATRGEPVESAWEKGSENFAVRHRGRVYFCRDEAARREMLGNPDLYSPILSGCDMVEYLRSGSLADGKCEFGFIDRVSGRVFLFCSKENWAEFARNCEEYSRIVDEQSNERVARESSPNVQR